MKPTSSSSQGTPYRLRQSLGKAIKRLQAGLPLSPRKQRFVVETFAKSVGIAVSSSSSQQSTLAESEDCAALVNFFYSTDDISWKAPGRKDHVIIRSISEDGQKTTTTQQTRYMLMSLREA